MTKPEPLDQWQPIDSAPKDGTPILAWIPEPGDHPNVYVLMWTDTGYDNGVPVKIDGSWVEAGGEQWEEYKPSHWQRLPAGPAAP